MTMTVDMRIGKRKRVSFDIEVWGWSYIGGSVYIYGATLHTVVVISLAKEAPIMFALLCKRATKVTHRPGMIPQLWRASQRMLRQSFSFPHFPLRPSPSRLFTSTLSTTHSVWSCV